MSTYNLEMEATITVMHDLKSPSMPLNSVDYPLYFDVLVDANNISEAREKGKALIKKYYPNATYIAFTHVDPSC